MAFFVYHPRNQAQPHQGTQPLHMGTPAGAPLKVSPPSQFAQANKSPFTWLMDAWRWLWDMEPNAPQVAPFPEVRKVRADFHAALIDLHTPKSFHTRYQVEASRSLRELWHLRTDVFEVVAEQLGEAEAKKRTAALNKHFPDGPARHPREGLRAGKVTTW